MREDIALVNRLRPIILNPELAAPINIELNDLVAGLLRDSAQVELLCKKVSEDLFNLLDCPKEALSSPQIRHAARGSLNRELFEKNSTAKNSTEKKLNEVRKLIRIHGAELPDLLSLLSKFRAGPLHSSRLATFVAVNPRVMSFIGSSLNEVSPTVLESYRLAVEVAHTLNISGIGRFDSFPELVANRLQVSDVETTTKVFDLLEQIDKVTNTEPPDFLKNMQSSYATRLHRDSVVSTIFESTNERPDFAFNAYLQRNDYDFFSKLKKFVTPETVVPVVSCNAAKNGAISPASLIHAALPSVTILAPNDTTGVQFDFQPDGKFNDLFFNSASTLIIRPFEDKPEVLHGPKFIPGNEQALSWSAEWKDQFFRTLPISIVVYLGLRRLLGYVDSRLSTRRKVKQERNRQPRLPGFEDSV